MISTKISLYIVFSWLSRESPVKKSSLHVCVDHGKPNINIFLLYKMPKVNDIILSKLVLLVSDSYRVHKIPSLLDFSHRKIFVWWLINVPLELGWRG